MRIRRAPLSICMGGYVGSEGNRLHTLMCLPGRDVYRTAARDTNTYIVRDTTYGSYDSDPTVLTLRIANLRERRNYCGPAKVE